MKTHIFQTILGTGLFAAATAAQAEEFSHTPKQETMAEAIRFEKYKIAAAEAQAKKDASEAAEASKPTESGTATAKRMARKAGQADAAKKLRDGANLAEQNALAPKTQIR
jgi:hypothetical protein